MSKLRLPFLPLILVLAMAGVAPAISPSNDAKIHVYVIGVTHFAIGKYNENGVPAAIALRCDMVASFFKERFPNNKADIQEHCKPEETTRESIRRYLSVDLRDSGKDDLNFVFLISHGELVQYGNEFLTNDLRIIASDTTDADKEFTSISAATELLPWLQKLSSRSTTLVFIDTCYSGAAKSIGTNLEGRLQQVFGIKNLVLASSLASDESYNAAFTAAVLDVLQSTDCVPSASLPRAIRKKIQDYTSKTLTGTEGFPETVVPYVGSLCLGNLGTDGKLLFLYSGSEPETTKYRIVKQGSTSTTESDFVQDPFFVRRYDAGIYDIFLTRANQPEQKVKSADLQANDIDIIWLDEDATVQDAANFLEKASDVAKLNGNRQETVAALKLSAAAMYTANQDDASAQRIAASVPVEVRNKLLPPEVQKSAFNVAEVRKLLTAAKVPPDVLAKQLALAGDFKNAATVMNQTARSTTDPAAKREQLKGSYYLYGASGDVGNAAKLSPYVLSKSTLSDATLLDTQNAARSNSDAKESFKAASGVNALTTNVIQGAGKSGVK